MVEHHGWQAEQAEWPSLWLAALGSLRALATALPGLREALGLVEDGSAERGSVDAVEARIAEGAQRAGDGRERQEAPQRAADHAVVKRSLPVIAR